MTHIPQKDEWPLYVALLPALVTLAAIVIAAALGWDKHPLVNGDASNAALFDDYYQGLAKLGSTEARADPAPRGDQGEVTSSLGRPTKGVPMSSSTPAQPQ